MRDYIEMRSNSGLSDHTIINDILILTAFSKSIDKSICELTKSDIYGFFDSLSGCKKSTVQFHKVGLRSFLSFAGRGDLAGLCDFKRSKSDLRLPEDILTQDEVELLVENASNLRDKALIAVMYETGARRGELIDLQLKHVVFDEYGAVITLPKGKTGARRVRIVWSVGYLRNWMENHPVKEKDAVLWASFRDPTKTLEYCTLFNGLKNIAKKAGITKRVNPHSFRHSRATHLASVLTEHQLKQYLGWTSGSAMAGRYVHLSGRDTDDSIKKMYGIEVEETEIGPKLKVLKCPRCKEIQDSKASFCWKCGQPLTKESGSVETKAEEVFIELMNDPVVRDYIYKLVADMASRNKE